MGAAGGPARNPMLPRRLRLLRSLDRRFGPTLCRHWPRPRRGEAPAVPLGAGTVGRLLLIRPGGLGDAALTLPALGSLRQAWPGTRIEVLAENRNAGVYRLVPDLVDDLHLYDSSPVTTLRRLRGRYDLVVDTEQFHCFSALLAAWLGPRYLAGFGTLDRQRLHTHSVPYDEDRYEAQSFLDLVGALTGEPRPFDPERSFIVPDGPSRDWARSALAELPAGRVVAVCPGAAGITRLWNPERYGAVARWLRERGFGVVILGGGDAVEAARILDRTAGGGLLDLTGRTTLARTAGVLAAARLSISADTGLVHLAYGVGTPTVALFGSGRHRKWAPPGSRHRIVRLGLPCSPCTRQGVTPPCPYGVACMEGIPVAAVTAAAAELLPG